MEKKNLSMEKENLREEFIEGCLSLFHSDLLGEASLLQEARQFWGEVYDLMHDERYEYMSELAEWFLMKLFQERFGY